MTELELSLTLGIILEPEDNRLVQDASLAAEIACLKVIFNRIDRQKLEMGAVNPDIWCEFLPWCSLN